MEEEKILEARKEKLISFTTGFFKKNPNWIFLVVIILLIILGTYIRMQPLADHGGHPGLWDITTNDYTLGPDLDPFLFLRYAKTMISEGSLQGIDTMRNVPLYFDMSLELQMVPYMIVLTYNFINIFGDYSINFAGAFMPVIFFILTILSFFLFVRELFVRKDKKETILKANIIASISTLFMIVIPGFLSRTIAGIPEKESVGFFFLFLAFYLFVKAWKSEKLKGAIIFGVLSGIATALMGLTWGGVTYIYTAIAIAVLVSIFLNKVGKKEAIAYSLWVFVSLLMTLSLTNRFSLRGYITSLDTGLVFIAFMIMIIHFLVWKTNIKERLKLTKINLPKPIISLLVSIIFIIILILIILGPSFIIEKIGALNQMLIQPVYGRWGTTVAENRQPYFTEWLGNFGKFVFWAFIIGSILLFKKALKEMEKRKSYILTGFYTLFLFGLIFSRYAPHPSILDGEGTISKLFFFGSFLALICAFGYYYIKDHKEGKNSFKSINFEYIFIFSLLILTLFTARSAVRLIMVLVPIAPIFLAYLIVEVWSMSRKSSDKVIKSSLVILTIILLIFSSYHAYGFYKETKIQAYNFIPNYYTYQWQNAMSWVRDNTPQDAVFAHWWDYGYWVQSIGNRATITDGGNAIVWWNYLTGRLILTGDNQKDALDFLYNHNASHLLIDSSDMGKYGAYSQIGSNETFDRLSQGPFALISEERNMQETKNETIRTYNTPSGANNVLIYPIEEDITYEIDGTKTNLLKENTGLIGVKISYSSFNNLTSFNQPEAVFVSSNNKYVSVPIRYLKQGETFKDFGTGLESAVSIIQKVSQGTTGLQMDDFGALIYLSPRVLRGMMAQIYILDNGLNKFPNFKLVHSEPNLFIDSLNNQGAGLREFVYIRTPQINSVQGPIKIWEINYAGDEEINSEYTQKTVPDYVTWKF